MTRRTLLASVAALAALLSVAWSSAAAYAATPAVTTDALRNITYPSQYTVSRSAPLRDGTYDQRADLGGDLGAKNPAVVQFNSAVIGERYTAVLLTTNTGGSGIFLTLHLVTEQAGVPQAGPGLFLGDRWRINSMTIADDRLTLDVTRSSATDPLCCPTLHDVRVYAPDANGWVLISSTAATQAPLPPATGNAGLATTRASRPLELALAMAVISLLTVTRLAPARRSR